MKANKGKRATPAKRKPRHGSGKTHFNRKKKKGESWTALRQEAIKAGTWPLKKSDSHMHRSAVSA